MEINIERLLKKLELPKFCSDGKHFAMKCPNKRVSNWYSYQKGSIALRYLTFAMQIIFSLLLTLRLMVERAMRLYFYHQFAKDLDNGCLGIPVPSTPVYSDNLSFFVYEMVNLEMCT